MKYRLFTVTLWAVFLSFIVLGKPVRAQAAYDTLSIYDLQFVEDPETDDRTPFFGDTVVVRGLVMTDPRALWVGARWAVFIQDPDTPTDPWNGFFIIQHDTFAINTGLQFVQPGDVAYFTGVVDEFAQFSQIFLLTNPAVPVNVVSAGNPLPEPVLLTAEDLASKATGEQWESLWIRVEDAAIVNNNISGDWASFNDATGSTSYLAEYFNWFRDRLPEQGNGSYTWPSPGTTFNVNGFCQDVSGTPGQVYAVNPRDTLDMEILGVPPPVISDVMRDPGVPSVSAEVQVSATIVDENSTISEALVHYSVNGGAWQTVSMSATQDTYSGNIPGQPDNSFVRYFVTSQNAANSSSSAPGDTSMAGGRVYWYDIKSSGLTIRDVQYTHGYVVDNSGYQGYEVSVDGIVMTDSSDFVGYYYIEAKDSAWSGIWVSSDQGMPFNKGDEVSVTGMVVENFNVTRLNATSHGLLTAGVGAFEPVAVTTGEVTTGGANAEAYESVFIKLENLTVSNPFPDAPSNFGEFSVDDGSGAYRVDDFASGFRGNLDSTYGLGDKIATLQGMGYYSFGNYKLLPRDSMDVIGHMPVGVEEIGGPLPLTFKLDQNYPNPFNPTTDIEYTIAHSGNFTLVVFNILGQKVKTLANEFHSPGNYRARWDGLDDFGHRVGSGIYFYTLRGADFNITKKMILLK